MIQNVSSRIGEVAFDYDVCGRRASRLNREPDLLQVVEAGVCAERLELRLIEEDKVYCNFTEHAVASQSGVHSVGA